ncbi:MAG TPA: hypothetical protein VF411_11865 [Bacteroidia bacterium]
MSKETARIPHAIIAYYNFIKAAAAYLMAPSPISGFAANWNRLGLIAAENTYWQNQFTLIDPKYTIYAANPKGNPANTHAMHVIIDDHHAKDKINHTEDRIAAGNPVNMVDQDYVIFHIKHNAPILGGSLPTERKRPTLLFPQFTMIGVGEGFMHFVARAITASKRGALLKGYKLGIVYLILKAGEAVPTNTDQLTQHIMSSRANSLLKLGAANGTLRVAVAMFWEHPTNEALNGPKSAIQVLTIV